MHPDAPLFSTAPEERGELCSEIDIQHSVCTFRERPPQKAAPCMLYLNNLITGSKMTCVPFLNTVYLENTRAQGLREARGWMSQVALEELDLHFL